jgi:hypothetical protein
MDWFETVMKIVIVVASVGGLLTLKRLLTGPRGDRRYPWWARHGRGEASDPELAELRQAVERLTDELTDARDRLGGEVAELQERLDFAERMLAQQRERQSLPER